MLHNLGGSGGIRNDRENRSFCEVVYMFCISSAKWCICDIHHLHQRRENGETSVHIIIYIYIYIYIYIQTNRHTLQLALCGGGCGGIFMWWL